MVLNTRLTASLSLAALLLASSPTLAQGQTTPLPPGTAVSEPGISDDSPPYTLGAGDIVRLDSFDTQEIVFEQRYTILLDGTLNLPWIGSISVQGLTLEQAGAKISDRYREFVRNPRMTISLVAPRPLKVGVIGEVNRPGSYIISVISNEITQASLNQRSSAEGGNQWPTVSKALQTAGGITQGASIRTIKVRRILPSGEERLLDVDLWKFLQEGDLDQDRLLRDGDAIIVSRAETLDAAEATQVAQSNFSPAEIRVSVVGEVLNPGTIALRPNTTLNQAILTAGGFRPVRARKVDVELIRLNPNGSVSRRNYKIDLSRGLDDTVNPPLHNNDVVVVNRTGIAKIADTLGVVLTPLSGVFSLFTILGLSRN